MAGRTFTEDVHRSKFIDPAATGPVAETLADPIRRRVLVALSDRGSVEVRASTDPFADEPDGTDPDILRRRLVRTHLPKLAEDGYVEWDPDTGTVRRGPEFDDVVPFLEVLAGATNR